MVIKGKFQVEYVDPWGDFGTPDQEWGVLFNTCFLERGVILQMHKSLKISAAVILILNYA